MCDNCTDDIRKAGVLIEQIEELCPEVAEKNDSGQVFAESVEHTTLDIADWIAENDHVTDAQLGALKCMRDGLERWID